MASRKKDSQFDYEAAVSELETIAARVESADTGIDDIDRYIRRSAELISGCRAYLRTARDKADGIGVPEDVPPAE